MNSQWNVELIYKLIDLYHERPVLWNTELEEFKDRDKKNEAWNEISQALDIERDTVERKMRILVFQFRRELLKVKLSSVKNSKWFAFKQMLFLKDKWAHSDRRQISRDELKIRVRSLPSEVNTWRNVPETTAYRKRPALKDTVVGYITGGPIPDAPAPSKRRYQDNESEEGFRKNTNNADNPTRDEFTIFGEYVATKLRKLDDTFASNTAQHHINNILYNAGIGKYNKSQRNRNSQENCKFEHPEEEVAFEDIVFEEVEVP